MRPLQLYVPAHLPVYQFSTSSCISIFNFTLLTIVQNRSSPPAPPSNNSCGIGFVENSDGLQLPADLERPPSQPAEHKFHQEYIDFQELAKSIKDDMEKQFTVEKEKAMEKRLKVKWKNDCRKELRNELQEEYRQLYSEKEKMKRDMEKEIREQLRDEIEEAEKLLFPKLEKRLSGKIERELRGSLR